VRGKLALLAVFLEVVNSFLAIILLRNYCVNPLTLFTKDKGDTDLTPISPTWIYTLI